MIGAQSFPKKATSALEVANCSRLRKLTPRQQRVIGALSVGPLLREEVDRIAGASNGPQVIAELRHGLGIGIHMERVDRIDRDGRPCKPGLYSLTGSGRRRVAELEGLASV